MSKLEAPVQQAIKLAAPRLGMSLWRNNVGALPAEDGRLVRYGLCNDTKALNKRFKSADLIGLTQHVITQQDVGRTVAIFTSLETKREDWCYGGTPAETAQKRWRDLIIEHGGIAGFVTRLEDIKQW